MEYGVTGVLGLELVPQVQAVYLAGAGGAESQGTTSLAPVWAPLSP